MAADRPAHNYDTYKQPLCPKTAESEPEIVSDCYAKLVLYPLGKKALQSAPVCAVTGIYLMSDVISQCSGIARLCVCQRQIGSDDRGPAYIRQPRDYSESFREQAAWRSRGERAEDPPRSPRQSGWAGLRAEAAGIAGWPRLETVPAVTSMRLIMEDRSQMPNGKRL